MEASGLPLHADNKTVVKERVLKSRPHRRLAF